MKAAVRERYGGPVEIKDVDVPEVADDRVLVRVRATSINRGDYYTLVGEPKLARPMMGGIRRPKSPLLGGDFAGVVEAVGAGVSEFKPGDEVFGGKTGAFAEYVAPKESLALKPERVSFEEAAAVPIAALTALQAMRRGELEPGQRVLINGASGGVGTFAVQIAKAYGPEVTAVTSTPNLDLARSLGADHAVDYTREDFTRSGERYDVIFDNAGTRGWRACKRVLKQNARFVVIGGPMRTPLVGPLGHVGAVKVSSIAGSLKATFFVASFNRADMDTLRDMLESGAVRPVIEETYPFDQIAEALRKMGSGHVAGKLVVTI